MPRPLAQSVALPARRSCTHVRYCVSLRSPAIALPSKCRRQNAGSCEWLSGCRDRSLSRSRCLLVVPARTCGTVCRRCDRLRSHCRQSAAVKTPALVSGSVGAETARSVGRAACSSFLHARAVLCVAAIACDRTAVNTLALVRGSVGAETARSVGGAACCAWLSGCRDRPLSRSRCLLVVPARTCGTVCR